MIKISDYIAEYFLANGIDTCFTVTGGGAMHLNDSFGHHSGFRNVYNHHEQACAIAAEGYARLSGKPALVSVTSGPGATNAITGVYGAWADSIPMIVLSGQMKRETLLSSTPVNLRYLGFQESAIIEMIESVTKYSCQINDPKYLQYHLDTALAAAISGRKGPVWLDIPVDIQGAQMSETTFLGNITLKDRLESAKLSNIDPKLGQVIDHLSKSKKPVLMLGEEVQWSGNAEKVKNLCEKLNIPVVTEWNAHDLIPNEHRLYCGRPGTIGTRGGNFVVQDSDLIIILGCQLSIRQLSYEWANFAKDAIKIVINSDYNELDKPTLSTDLSIIYDCGDFSVLLIEALSNRTFDHAEWLKWCKDLNDKYPVLTDDHYDESKPLNVYAVVDQLTRHAPDNACFVLANGAACVVGLQASVIKQGTRIFTNSGASGMGYGVAAAIGAAVARKNTDPVVCIEGDGSLMMNLQELQTIKTNDQNVKMIILNNGGYHSIKQTQNNLFNAKSRGYCGADEGSGVGFPNFEIIAKAFDIDYLSATQLNQLKASIEQLFAVNHPIILELFVDPDQDFEPKLISKMREDGTFFTPSLEDMYPFLSRDELFANKFHKKTA
jgi:acetolactate synthase I/II/III large subunit